MPKPAPPPPPAKVRPSASFRVGFVKATVWRNENHFNVTVTRSFKQDNEWRDGDSFGHGDLLNLAKVVERAEAFIADQVMEQA